MALTFDHVFCLVDDLDQTAARINDAGWTTDAGSAHPGQGTRNRRVAWPEHYLELLCVVDRDEAAGNRLSLDQRAAWRHTGASPFGIGLRGQLPDQHRADYWLYDELGVRIWVHRDTHRAPDRPLVFALELTAQQLRHRAARTTTARPTSPQPASAIQRIEITAAEAPRLPAHDGPAIVHTHGEPQLTVHAGPGPAQPITDILAITPPAAMPTAGTRAWRARA